MTKFTLTALAAASVASLSAQSLFDLAPAEDESESLPLTWTASVGLGYDDNPTPLFLGGSSSAYGTVNIGASVLNVTPQTRTEFFARVGAIHYFDELGLGLDKSTETYGLGLNWNHRVSERLRVVSRNYFTQELEPDRSTGIGGLVQLGAYSRWSTDNSVGYRWSERLGTYTGMSYQSISYDAFGYDVDALTFYNDFRYVLSPQTVATLTYRHSSRDIDGPRDSTNQFILAGLEQRFSPNTIGVVRAGVQLREIDGIANSDTTNPSLEASLQSRVNSQLKLSAYVRYSNEDYTRRLGVAFYDTAETLRMGVRGSYALSDKLSIHGGLSYSDIGYDDLVVGPVGTLASPSEDIISLNLGLSLRMTDTISLSGNYVHEDFGSDQAGRAFDRNRLNFGISAQF